MYKAVLKIAYDGGSFLGFQRQKNAESVQGRLEATLTKILSSPIQIVGAGRTDAGVHAMGQVVCFICPKPLTAAALTYSLNCLLPPSIRVIEAVLLEADNHFQPRFDALSRTYSYYLVEQSSPLERLFFAKRAWCLRDELDLELTHKACTILSGVHDFSSFSYKMPKDKSRVREVLDFSLSYHQKALPQVGEERPRLIRLSISANGFLRRMVRLLTTAVVQVGLEKLSLDELSSLLKAANPHLAPHLAPAQGLYLEKVSYEPDPFKLFRGSKRHHLAQLALSPLLR